MERQPPWPLAILSGLLLALGLWAMRSALGPLVVSGALVFLLWPWRQEAWVRRLLLVALGLLGFWILAKAQAVVYPTLAGLAFAFLLDPAVDRLEARRIPRPLAVLMLLLPLLGALLALGLLLVPVMISQGRTLIERLPDAYATVAAWLTPLLAQLPGATVTGGPPALPNLLPHAETILRGVFSGVVQVGRGVGWLLQLLSFLLLTPILTYYLLVDFDRLRVTLRPQVPQSWLPRVALLGEYLQSSVGAWLKGQLLVALAVAILLVAGFLIVGLPYALLIGCLGGILNLLPVLGFWTTAALALVAALFTPAPLQMILKLAAVFAVAQVLEQQILSPRIVSRKLGVKPVVLLITMLAMGSILGVLGILLAAPALGIARWAWAVWGRTPAPAKTALEPDAPPHPAAKGEAD